MSNHADQADRADRNDRNDRDTESLDPAECVRRLTVGDQILYLDEAAAFVRKPEGTMRYYRHLGIGPRSFRHGRRVAYWKTDLILWLTSESTSPRGRDNGAHAHARPQAGRSQAQNRRTREGG
ncbi:hypothetical protein [Nocardioides sp. Kera G14]|uniref:hypothetical protein n=1 Tax=Nocardioides sp. Kera G14 TaxID=2884264 RepID=UPI001D111331|nr:hypothetical protein [Nocardioides sp. Kera G14]UDY25044.1 hypothetical protein LH076_07060 [Nocardioides sp. Kera G14]